MNIFKEAAAYHDSKKKMDDRNASKYGQPVYSLYACKKFVSVHGEITVTNGDDQVVYVSRSKAVSLHDVTSIVDKDSNEVASMKKKSMFSLHAKHLVTMDDGTSFQMSNELLLVPNVVIDIEGLGWQIKGTYADLKFELLDEKGKVIALIGHKMVSIKDQYCVDIYRPEYEKLIVSILITLQHMIMDKENARASGTGRKSGGIVIGPSIR